jgi:hypothetical protein
MKVNTLLHMAIKNVVMSLENISHS